MKSPLTAIKNVILWSHERGTWQYDMLCLLIICTVFFVPSRYFGDRDRASVKNVKTNEVSIIASESGETVREITVSDLQTYLQKLNKPELMLNSPEEAIRLYLSDRLNQDVTVSKFEPFMNPQKRVSGYRVWTK